MATRRKDQPQRSSSHSQLWNPSRSSMDAPLGRSTFGRFSKTPMKSSGSASTRATISGGRTSRTPLRQMRPSNRNTFDGRTNRSSLIKGEAQTSKDPRDLKSKAWQTSAIIALLDFLAKKGFNNGPHKPLSRRALTSPSTKEFKSIFEFMVGHITPNYTIGATGLKLEQEVHNVIRDLGYNYMLNRQHLATVGAPHSWPYALGALDWLRELLEIEDAIEFGEGIGYVEDPTNPSDFMMANPEIRRLVSLEETRGYAHYLETGTIPEFDGFAEELDRIVLGDFGEEDLHDLRKKNKELCQAWEARLSQDDDMHEVRAKLDEQLEIEHAVLEQQVSLETDLETIATEIAEAKQATEANKKRKLFLEEEIIKVQEKVDKQPKRREDVEELLLQRQNMESELNYREKMNIELMEDNGRKERQLANRMASMEPKGIALGHVFNELSDLKIYPELLESISVSQFRQPDVFIPRVKSILTEIEDGLSAKKQQVESTRNMNERVVKQMTEECRQLALLHHTKRKQLELLNEEISQVRERVVLQEGDMVQKRLAQERILLQMREASAVKEKDLRSATDRVRRADDKLKFRDSELSSKVAAAEAEYRGLLDEVEKTSKLNADWAGYIQEWQIH